MAYSHQNEGLIGWSNRQKRFLASTEGILGFAPKKDQNLRLNMMAPPGGGAITDVTLRIRWEENGPQEELIPFRPEFNPYERTLPSGVLITIDVLNPAAQYQALTRTVTLQPAVPQSLTLQLQFRAFYAYCFRRRFL